MTAQPAAPHRRAERPPLRDPFLALLVVALVIAVLETLVVEDPSWVVRTLYGIGGAAVVTAVFFRAVAEQRRRATAEARAALARHEEAGAVLAEQVLPALLERLRDGDSAETALAACPSPDDASHRSVLRQVAAEVGRAEAARAATTAAGANAAGRMQALATSMLADLREMEHRHGGEDVLADLLHLDHRTAQAGRIADSIAVLTGARSGRRWAKPIVMESILRGAMGRIAGYQRVRLHSTSTAAIAGHAAEGVMHALAELMDNATSFSPPTAEVHVYVEEVPSGIVVTVEDSGLVMGEVALRRAEQAVTAEKLDISALSGTRLGLAVVGSLARKHGLTVSFRPSARGGTGVLVRIPQALVSHPQRDDATEPPATPSVPAQDLLAGLPSRRASRRTSAGAHPAPLDNPASAPAAEPAASPGRPEARTGEGGPAGTAEHGRTGDEAAVDRPTASRPDGAAVDPGNDPAADPTETMQLSVPRDIAGLPRRRRGRTLAAAHPEGAPQTGNRLPERSHTPAQSAARFGAFRRAVQGGAAAEPTQTASPKPEDDSR